MHFSAQLRKCWKVQAAGSERISREQREELVDRIESAGVPTGPDLQNGNGVVISSTALADRVDYSSLACLSALIKHGHRADLAWRHAASCHIGHSWCFLAFWKELKADP